MQKADCLSLQNRQSAFLYLAKQSLINFGPVEEEDLWEYQ
jgi:hypothetical protein